MSSFSSQVCPIYILILKVFQHNYIAYFGICQMNDCEKKASYYTSGLDSIAFVHYYFEAQHNSNFH